jgi:5-methylcytosine-specific restriction protein B
MTAFTDFMDVMLQGRSWSPKAPNDAARGLMDRVYEERYSGHAWQRAKYQLRANLERDESNANYAAWITAENPTSGAFQGTSFTWFPGEGGSVAVLCIGLDGWGPDGHILQRPGHRRRLKALSRLHGGRLWVKPDPVDTATQVPKLVSERWPAIPAALKAYDRFIYAAVAVRQQGDAALVEDLLDLFFAEHDTPTTKQAKKRWEQRETAIASALFPAVDEEAVLELLHERRFVVLEGPPGTGKTRLAYRLADLVGRSTRIQFHPARTYEDFVVGLHPRPTDAGLAFEVRAGDLLRAAAAAEQGDHLLVIDEINRADLARVLGEALVLFEPSEPDRTIRLPYAPPDHDADFGLPRGLMVLGTRNTADRTIARMDLAIRRRFAFVEVWPDLQVVEAQGFDWAQAIFHDVLMTFAEYADEEVLRLVPGHSYLLDPRPDLPAKARNDRIVRRVELELLPLLRDYLDERLTGSASEPIRGLVDRIEARVLEWQR